MFWKRNIPQRLDVFRNLKEGNRYKAEHHRDEDKAMDQAQHHREPDRLEER